MSRKSVNSAKRGKTARRPSRLRAFVKLLQVLVLLGIGASVGVGLGMFVELSESLDKIGDIEAPDATIIYSSDNVELARIYREDRTNVDLDKIPASLRDATIAIEDSRFYKHAGIDIRGIARAAYINLRGGAMEQGGSTITQQLARNVYLTQEKRIERKMQEAVLALLIERNLPKDKILELYLNRVYYGSGAFGVQAASRVYFGKDVEQLTLSESALLAGLPKKPSVYSPHVRKDLAVNRRDIVLNRMAELEYITPEQRDEAKDEQIKVTRLEKGRSLFRAPHFVDYISRQIKKRYGEDLLYSGGLKIYTTLNYEMQKIAEKSLREGVRKHESAKRVSEGCLVCVEAESGFIRAMVGSVDPSSQFNRSTQSSRQPGSAFKPFVYAAAFQEAGMRPSEYVVDAPVSFPGGGSKTWKPKNYDGRYRGSVTIRTAIAQSINIPAIKVANKVGIETVIKYAQLMGIKSELEPYLSTAIGGVKGVHPLEMAAAYNTFANGGVFTESCSIVRVENGRGDVLYDYVPEGRRVLTEKVNTMLDDCLRAVVTEGTARKASPVRDARGKTGTTNEDRDAWFVGYVPHKLVAAVWVGNDDNRPMRSAYGGQVCAPIWAEFMQKSIPIFDTIHKDDKQTEKKRSETDSGASSEKDAAPQDDGAGASSDSDSDVTATDETGTVSRRICPDSGMLATPSCPSASVEVYSRGNEPTSYCTVHGSGGREGSTDARSTASAGGKYVEAPVCPDSGMLAGANCPRRVMKRFPVDSVPTQICTIHNRAGQE